MLSSSMKQRKYTTEYAIPNSGEAWNSEVGIRADDTAPDTVLFTDDQYYDLAMGKVKEANND